jgi:hypothetical protein
VTKDKAPDGLEKPKKERNLVLIRDLAGLYGLVGVGVMRFNMYDGIVLVKGAEDRAREVVRVAEKHPWLLAFLKRMMKASVYGSFAIGHGMMAYAILSNHDRLPKDENILALYGYTEAQLFRPPQEEQNGSVPTSI